MPFKAFRGTRFGSHPKRLSRTFIPATAPIIVLADQTFGRAELARVCQELGLHYVVRIKLDVHVRRARYRGKLLDYPVKCGTRRVLKNVEYRHQRPIAQHMAVLWKRGLPKRRDEPWFLMSELDALRQSRIMRADRFDRLLLILALAYILLVAWAITCGFATAHPIGAAIPVIVSAAPLSSSAACSIERKCQSNTSYLR